ncbi:MAG: DUF2339 domain-containing protein [Bacteroidota bacterium]
MLEFLLLVAIIIILVLLFIIRSTQKESQQRNEQAFKSIKKDLLDLKEQLSQPGNTTLKEQTALKPTDENVVQWRPAPQPVPVPKPKEPEPKPLVPPVEEKVTPVIRPAVKIPTVTIVKPTEPKEGWWDKWVRNNPDFEKFVGENLANKIGIAVLVLGIGFFVKYAIDQNWIKEAGRVAIGIGCGIIMIGIAHYLRNTYRSFSSVMAGGGIAVFYFTIAFAFHEYNMFSQTTAFAIMVVITAFAVAIALLYDKIELAVIAVLGGFLAPFLVSNGSGNYIVLFTYLIILNIGILTISYFKKWPLLHIISFFFTLIIFGGWLIDQLFGSKIMPYKNALLFASSFYVIFIVIILVYNIRKQRPFKAFDFTLLMLVTFSYYFEGISILDEWNDGAYQGLFTIVMSVINLCLAWWLYVSHKGDKNLLYLLIGLTLTFLSLAAPVQLHGHSITMFWAAEAVLVYWLHQKSKINIFKYSSSIVLIMMLISLLMDWSLANERSVSNLPVIFTNWQGIVTNIVAVISLSLYAFLLRKQTDDDYVIGIRNRSAAIIMAILALLITYFSLIFGVNLHFSVVQYYDIPNVYHQIITYGFIAILMLALKKIKPFELPVTELVLVLAAFALYIFSTIATYNLVDGVIQDQYATKHLYMHLLGDILLLYLFYELIKILRAREGGFTNGIGWLINILLLIFFSIECRHLYVSIFAGEKSIYIYHAQYMKAGLTIVWAIYSFVIIWLGMKHKYKTLRIISLSIFTLALLKLFLFDIRNISAGGKIAAFIMLGVLLLVISFMYQRLKKIIIDNEEKTA